MSIAAKVGHWRKWTVSSSPPFLQLGFHFLLSHARIVRCCVRYGNVERGDLLPRGPATPVVEQLLPTFLDLVGPLTFMELGIKDESNRLAKAVRSNRRWPNEPPATP
jgi:hypothetical protein